MEEIDNRANEEGNVDSLKLDDDINWQSLKSNWRKLPFFFFFYAAVGTTLWIFEKLLGISKVLAHHPGKVIFSLQIWQPFTCFYMNDGFFSLIISLLCIFVLTLQSDHVQGSAYTIIHLNTQSLFTQII